MAEQPREPRPFPDRPASPRPASIEAQGVDLPSHIVRDEPASASPRVSQTALGCLIGAGIVAAALLIAGMLVSAALREAATDAVRLPENLVATALPAATPTIVARPPAVLQVRAISDLATAQSLLSTVVEAEKARIGDVVYERLVLIACGRVKAGIDLSSLADGDVVVSDDGKTVRVRLPQAQLLDAYLIDDSTQPCTTKVYDRTNLLLLPPTAELESQARERAVQAIRDTAVQSGILSDARRNAEIAIERILLNAGYESVEFVQE